MPRFALPRIELSPILPAVVAVVVASILLWLLIPRLVETNAAVELDAVTRILTPVVAEALPAPPEALQERIVALARGDDAAPVGRRLRLTVLSRDGQVLADSARTFAEMTAMDDHSGRPEVAAALATGAGQSVRQSKTTGLTYVYAARPFTGPDGRPYVLRLAQPLTELGAVEQRLMGTMAIAALSALAVAFAVYLWLSHRLFRPLRKLVRGAQELADGALDRRLVPPEEPRIAALTDALNRLADRVEREMGRVRAERDHLEAIVSSMSDGVLVTDAGGRALLANPELRRIFRLTGPIDGLSPVELTRRVELAAIVQATLAAGEPQTATVELDTPDRRAVALSSATLVETGAWSGDQQTLQGVVVVARDVTQGTRLEEMRRDFVANVSHELKTPLSAIRGYAETLRDGAIEDPGAAGRFVERILVQCWRLQELLDDLLTLSRLESPEGVRETAPIDLAAAARRALEVVAEAARARGIALRIRRRPGELPSLDGDREGIDRMLLNLLDNAVKYNRDGGRVTLSLGWDGDQALIEVADTGIGIPEESLRRIFERFYRVDKARSRADGGTGLGLAIVKHVAQSHGGHVDVESTQGEGTTFRVWLPSHPTSGVE